LPKEFTATELEDGKSVKRISKQDVQSKSCSKL
jgi:hypothetical protein